MKPDEWQNVKRIFNAALSLGPAERDRFLSDECGGDVGLRDWVEKLLGTYRSTFLEDPIMANDESDNRRISSGGLIGRYEILSLIGVGGMGEVYLARDNKLDRNVAIKVLNEKYERDEQYLQRFVREAKAASALNHPNILTIYEIGQTEDSNFIVSEFVDGKTLRRILGERMLSLTKVLDVSTQIAEALAAAHSARIIHRDIKPENIIVRSDGYVKVVDFGLAKLIPSQPSFIGLEDDTVRLNQTAQGLIMGTVSYMSPEQARGLQVDERTDIFSLGVLMYEMLAGNTPFAGGSMSETLANLLTNDPPPLSQFAPGVTDDLQQIVSKMLRKQADERYQTMMGLLADLKELEDRHSSEAKLDRIYSPQTEKETALLMQDTDDIPHKTVESRTPRRWYRQPVFLSTLLILITGVIAFGWYWRMSATIQPQIRSLAVLPLRSLDASDDSLGLGLADSIIRRLSSTGSVIVRPTSAVRKYMHEDTDALTAASQLKADAVLEGSVQRSGDRLRVAVNLLRTNDGASIWNDKFDLKTSDIFAVQDTISQKVAAGLKLKLDPSQRALLGRKYTSNAEAYEYFVKGSAEFEQATTSIGDMRAMEASIGYFRKAVEIDPNYALAQTKLGAVYMWIANFNEPDNLAWVEKAKVAWAKAEAIDPTLAELHEARFEYYYSKHGNWDISRAIEETRAAMKLNPSVGHYSWGTFYDHIGLGEDVGVEQFRRALEIDPTNIVKQSRFAESYRLFGNCDKANETHLHYFREPFPAALVCRGDVDQSIALLETIVKKNPGDIVNRAFLALAYAKKGNKQEAQALIPALIKDAPENRAYHHVTYNIAGVYALGGNPTEAVRWLRVTAETGMPNYPAFVRDPDFNRIRQSPEFQNFLAEVKPTWERYRDEIEGA